MVVVVVLVGCFLLFQLRGIKRCARHSCEKTVGNLCDSAVPVAGLPDSDIPEVWKKKKKKTEEEEEGGGGGQSAIDRCLQLTRKSGRISLITRGGY